jgi:hypothetical protein
MQNLAVHLGSATPLSSRPAHKRPRSPPRPLIDQPHLSAAPPPGTMPRPTRQAPLSPRSGCCRAPSAGRGQAPRHPTPRGTPTPGTPHFFPPLSPLPRCRRAARSPLALLHSFPCPHSSPTPSLERPSFPTAPRTRTRGSDGRRAVDCVGSPSSRV